MCTFSRKTNMSSNFFKNMHCNPNQLAKHVSQILRSFAATLLSAKLKRNCPLHLKELWDALGMSHNIGHWSQRQVQQEEAMDGMGLLEICGILILSHDLKEQKDTREKKKKNIETWILSAVQRPRLFTNDLSSTSRTAAAFCETA